MDPRQSPRLAPVVLALAALSACSREPERADNITVISVPTPAASQPAPATPAAATPLPPPVATPTYRPPLSQMKPRKTFTDPPLPPELRDDGGLKPLSPPPDPRK